MAPKKKEPKKEKKSFDVQVINILDKLAKREVGVDIDIAQLKEDYLPKEQPAQEEEEVEEGQPV